MAEQVGCDDVVRSRQTGEHRTPGTRTAGKSVEEDHGLSLATTPVADIVAMDDDMRQRESLHEATITGRPRRDQGEKVTKLRHMVISKREEPS
jgi:hypothetical protein